MIGGVERLSQTDRERLGRNISRLRNRLGFSQEELAERSVIQARYLQRIEAGEYGGSVAVLKRIRRELKAEWNEILDGL